MKTLKLLFFTLLLSPICYSQFKTVEIDYIFKIETENSEQFIYNHRMIASENKSVSGIIDSSGIKAKIRDRNKIFFDNNKDEILLQSAIFNKEFYVKESNISSKMTWELINEKIKEILGYRCKSAKLKFRGRNYIAYYAEDILCNFGPFKFKGLPGLILEVYSDDLRFHYIANRISLKDEITVIENPYKKIKSEDFISFKKYKNLFLEKLVQAQKKMQTEETDDTTYSVDDKSMELYD